MLMRLTILNIFFSLSIFCFGQSREIEKLANEAAKTIVPKDFRYFNLVDSSFIMKIKHSTLSNYNPKLDEFIKDNPDFNVQEILSLSEKAERISWHNYKIDRAILYQYNNIPKFATHLRIIHEIPFETSQFIQDSLNQNKKYNEVILPVKKSWSKKRRNKEANKKWEERDKNTVLENKKYFIFSTPIFSSNGKYAIMQLITGGEGSITYVFKRKNKNWVILSAIDGFVY